MIERRQGDLLQARVEALVNPVNCVGVMGKGLALQFRHAYPRCYEEYRAACANGELRPGRVLVHELDGHGQPRFVIDFPTKRHWRDPSRLEDIEAGLVALTAEVVKREMRSLALPALGCGLGGLDWTDVASRIEASMLQVPYVQVLLFEPGDGMDRLKAPQSMGAR